MTSTAPEREAVLPRPMQHQYGPLFHPARFKVLLCGRRYGKTTSPGITAATVGHGPGLRKWPGALYGKEVWWVAPTFAQTTRPWLWLCSALRGVWAKKLETPFRVIELPGGGRITMKSSDDPDTLRGEGLDLVIVDELKDHTLATWRESLRPALADKHGSAIFLGTPGPPDLSNLAYYLFRRAEGRKAWARWQRPTSDNPLVTPAELKELREELGEFAFSRECLAQFVVAGGGMFRPEWQRFYGNEGGLIYTDEQQPVNPWACFRFATCDLAASVKTYSDWSVVASWLVTPGGRLVLLDLVRGKFTGDAIVAAMKDAHSRHRLNGVWVEKTAYHAHLIDLAREAGVPIHELIADKDKVTRAKPAQAAMERGEVWFPQSAPWLGDLQIELASFPDPSTKDDQVDCLSYAVRIQGATRARPQEIVEEAPPERGGGWWTGLRG